MNELDALIVRLSGVILGLEHQNRLLQEQIVQMKEKEDAEATDL